MRTFVRVKIVVPGLHAWPNAPSKTAFLRDSHRHLFAIEVEVPVAHTDRDVEFFDFQTALTRALAVEFATGGPSADLQGLHDFGARSCEMIAAWVLGKFTQATRCTVSEDGENLGGAER